jgi:hypothetical protein
MAAEFAHVPVTADNPVRPAEEVTWSRWSRCESSFSFLLAPNQPGVFALAEEVIAPGETALSGGRRMLAIFDVAAVDDLGRSLVRLFSASSPVHDRVAEGRIFVRYAVIDSPELRADICSQLQRWVSASVEAATGIAHQPASSSSQPVGTAEGAVQQGPAPSHSSPRSAVPPPGVFPAGF